MNILVVGTVAFDAIETPFGKTDKIIGGAATYISLAASYFVKPINIISVIGDDFPSEDLLRFKNMGLNLDGLQIKKNEKSFFWSGKYRNDMNTRDTLKTELNVLADFNPIVPEKLKDCDYLMLGNLTPSVQQKVISQLIKRPKLIVMDTMNFWMDTAKEELLKVIAQVDVLTINDEEARQLSGDFSLVSAAKKILGMGPRFLVIKKGEHGALLFHKNDIFYAPALPLEEVFDPTGAGDTFAGGFIGYLAKKNDITFENMKRALIYGSALASFCVEKFGPEKLFDLSDKLITARVSEFINLSQFEMDYFG
ncbi:MAG: sugar kinase [Bacteroidetes bacterium RIFCSPLOWO2_02_FULL_36_8]|nr:MAG: sugar kinase [Bacteroidetes bacterium RIFCSPLOWO2_02_FULL_36_8]OFY70707.1 MAG: sugar kinase [Bacteroidetes bacterium RIFCSPLOWO2_12_FULL_37_12]